MAYMNQEMKKEKAPKIKAILKSYAWKEKLFSRIKSSFDGMIDGFSEYEQQSEFKTNDTCMLYNCCYRMELKVT